VGNHRPLFMFFELIVYILAVWRLTSLLVNEAGPCDLFRRVRCFVGVRYDDVNQPYGLNVLAEAFLCVWCLSVWVGLGVAIAHYLIPTVTFWVTLPLALSAGAVIISEVIGWLERVP